MSSSRFVWTGLLGGYLALGCGGTTGDPASGTAHQAILGGYVDKATKGVVGLAIDFAGHSFIGFCSGSLIAPNLVLTAHHCVSLTGGTPDGHVDCGTTQFTTTGTGDMFLVSPATVRPVSASDPSFHRGVDVRVAPGASDLCGHDVALIILDGAGIPASVAEPLVPRIDLPADPDELFSADGYGLTDPATTTTDGTRMRIDDNTVDCLGTTCSMLGDQVRASEWRSLDATVCSGDSGGPALDSKGRVFGVVSRGPDSCVGGIYSDVSAWKDFIVSTALEAAKMGGYDPPFWTSGSSTPPVSTTPTGADGGTSSLLGTECTGSCPGGYACYSENSKPPGSCVPRCQSAGDSCPDGYACAESLHACVPKDSSALPHGDSSCAVATPARRSLSWRSGLAAGLAIGILLARRRRERRARA